MITVSKMTGVTAREPQRREETTERDESLAFEKIGSDGEDVTDWQGVPECSIGHWLLKVNFVVMSKHPLLGGVLTF